MDCGYFFSTSWFRSLCSCRDVNDLHIFRSQCIREARRMNKPIICDILNYTKDGKKFWNRLFMRPLFDHSGELSHTLGWSFMNLHQGWPSHLLDPHNTFAIFPGIQSIIPESDVKYVGEYLDKFMEQLRFTEGSSLPDLVSNSLDLHGWNTLSKLPCYPHQR